MKNPAREDTLEYPDARIEVSVVCENHELESGVKQLNPILREILNARMTHGQTPKRPARPKNPHFGRLRFSQQLA